MFYNNITRTANAALMSAATVFNLSRARCTRLRTFIHTSVYMLLPSHKPIREHKRDGEKERRGQYKISILMETRGEGGCVGEVTTAGAGPASGIKQLLPDVYLPLASDGNVVLLFLLPYIFSSFLCFSPLSIVYIMSR